MSELYDKIVAAVARIPRGRVATYAQIAELAGNPRAARTVSYALHSSSRKLKLPWHRVINSRGTISLPAGGGYERQKRLLRGEGVTFETGDRIDLQRFGWKPAPRRVKKKTKAASQRKKAKTKKASTGKTRAKKIIRMPDERGPKS